MPDITNEPITVELTDEEWQAIVELYVFQELRPETLEVFRESLTQGRTTEEASYDALRNEAVNHVLEFTTRHNADVDVLPNNETINTADLTPPKMIWVTFQKEGIHMYPAAASDPSLKTGDWDDVSFLGVPHRHIFHFRVSIEVVHADRDIEFIQFKRWLERLYSEGTLELNHKSCEMISDDLHAAIVAKYPGRRMIIEVSEDGENGSTAEYPA